MTIPGKLQLRFRARLAALCCVSLASSIGAQVTMLPARSLPSARESYVLRVANDRQTAITRIELRFPRSAKVLSFGERPDWPVQVLGDSARVAGAVWTGILSPARFIDLEFVAANPARNLRLVWPVIITLADGERVMWWADRGSSTVAPETLVAAPPSSRGLLVALGICLLALVLAVAALILSLRSKDATGFQPGS